MSEFSEAVQKADTYFRDRFALAARAAQVVAQEHPAPPGLLRFGAEFRGALLAQGYDPDDVQAVDLDDALYERWIEILGEGQQVLHEQIEDDIVIIKAEDYWVVVVDYGAAAIDSTVYFYGRLFDALVGIGQSRSEERGIAAIGRSLLEEHKQGEGVNG